MLFPLTSGFFYQAIKRPASFSGGHQRISCFAFWVS